MSRNADLIARSLASVWHPCTQMQHHEMAPPVPIVLGEGVWLEDAEGRRFIDGVSSWWVNLFGHANAEIAHAIADQARRLEHAMLAGFTHEPVVQLSERLSALAPGTLGHAFYASDGASATEIALKMAFHYFANRGQRAKRRFAYLEGGYHGETVGSLAVTDVAIFRDVYAPLLTQHHAMPFPARDRQGHALSALESLFESRSHEIAALVVEPLVQGASGMRMYDAAYLRQARALCDQHDVLLIADEIMTGFGRTGTFFACEQAGVTPDFLCLSKGITGGFLPLSCVLTAEPIYRAFYDERITRGFLHSHSYTGNPIACRAACAVLDIFARDGVIGSNREKAVRFDTIAAPLAGHRHVRNARRLGMIWAYDIVGTPPDFSRAATALALEHGALLRPIGSTLYFMPPYVITDEEFGLLVKAGLAIADRLGGSQ